MALYDEGWSVTQSARAAQGIAHTSHHPTPGEVTHAIYLCDPRTEEECLSRSLLGLPASQAHVVRGIIPELSLLFLFNVRTRLLFGVFRATSWPEHNIEPLPWGHETGVSRYPLQVRVRLVTPSSVLQLAESAFRDLLDYQGTFNRFDLRLNERQATSLVQLFQHFGMPRRPLGRSSQEASSNLVDVPRRGQRLPRVVRNGVIFICDSITERECLSRRLLGLPKTQVSLLSKIAEGSLLFLFNVRARQLMGVFQPNGPPGMNLEPSAWGGRFPVQVRFRPLQTRVWAGQVSNFALKLHDFQAWLQELVPTPDAAPCSTTDIGLARVGCS